MLAEATFGIIGGDMRQIFLAKSLMKDGHKVLVHGFENADLTNHSVTGTALARVISESEYIILPVPVSRDGKTVNAPFAGEEIIIDIPLEKILENQKVFGGIISHLENAIKTDGFACLKDYYAREDFMVLNAVPTAEGAVKIAADECKKVIHKSNCLVVGYGRVGKALAKLLKDMGANVTVSARNPKDAAWIEITGCTPANIGESIDILDFDVIFNTVPHLIFDEKMLLRCPSSAVIIDLAAPAGVDFKFAEELNINAIHALALPGKFFPRTAGEIIKKTIYAMIGEENL